MRDYEHRLLYEADQSGQVVTVGRDPQSGKLTRAKMSKQAWACLNEWQRKQREKGPANDNAS